MSIGRRTEIDRKRTLGGVVWGFVSQVLRVNSYQNQPKSQPDAVRF